MTEEGQGKQWYFHFNGRDLSSGSSGLSENEVKAINEAMEKVEGSLNRLFANLASSVKNAVGDLGVDPLHSLSPAQLEQLKTRLPKMKTSSKDGHFRLEMNDEVVMELKLPKIRNDE
ncbi:hypothetical protein WQ57_16515 [Mesobacillus campisalis]|uniref:Uncharacterized protein n=1 Tax=Mesobacillus campisalis TaxID=1408103 RepID=A0A0M2SWI1_9BACI|nr:hypothetical protein [Mesobacillus campisalis]KKK36985.1 hypothetical protein WQ57_16515 [Mesobacillus campisalis]